MIPKDEYRKRRPKAAHNNSESRTPEPKVEDRIPEAGNQEVEYRTPKFKIKNEQTKRHTESTRNNPEMHYTEIQINTEHKTSNTETEDRTRNEHKIPNAVDR